MPFLLTLLLLFNLPTVVLAVDYHAECTIAFQASATLHDFQGAGQCQPFIVHEEGGILNIPVVRVPVAGLDTGNTKRDQQMREMFEAERFPLITGRSGTVSLSVVRQALADPDAATPDIPVQLKIRHIEQEILATVRNFGAQNDEIKADLEFSVSLAAFQLEPPSLLGIIRVGDRIDVKASFILQAR